MYLHLIREAKSKGKGGRSGCKPFCTADSACRYSYAFDDIGNRESSSERGTNSVYAANQLMEIYISKIVWAGFVALVRYGLGNRIARIISKHEEYR